MLTSAEKLEEFERKNLQSALLILADPEGHGGESALCVIWAGAVLRSQSRLALVEENAA